MPALPPLSDAITEPLRQLIAETDGRQWLIADYVAGVLDELCPYYEARGIHRARPRIIHQLANQVACDDSTLRDADNMARFFTREVREEFSMLSYHQFRAVKSAGENWREHAEWAAVNLPAPCSLIRSRIKSNGQLVPAWEGRWERLIDLCYEIVGDEKTPERIRGLIQRFLDSTE